MYAPLAGSAVASTIARLIRGLATKGASSTVSPSGPRWPRTPVHHPPGPCTRAGRGMGHVPEPRPIGERCPRLVRHRRRETKRKRRNALGAAFRRCKDTWGRVGTGPAGAEGLGGLGFRLAAGPDPGQWCSPTRAWRQRDLISTERWHDARTGERGHSLGSRPSGTFNASASRALALPGFSGCCWLSCGAQPDTQTISKVARTRPSASAKRSA